MTATITLQELAADARGFFTTGHHEDGTAFVSTVADTPDWVMTLVRDAHGDLLPDDWRYENIRFALDCIAENPDPDDGQGEFADQAVDTYSTDRLRWLASNLNRADYVDDACEEFGAEGLTTVERIGLGQYAEASEVYGSVWASLEQERQNRES